MNRRGYGDVKMEVDTARMTLYGIDEARTDLMEYSNPTFAMHLDAGKTESHVNCLERTFIRSLLQLGQVD